MNGLFYGDGDSTRYTEYATSEYGSKLYTYYDAATADLYVALVVSPNVNDNIITFKKDNSGYHQSNPPPWGTWGGGQKRDADTATNSEYASFSLQCGSSVNLTWQQGHGCLSGGSWISDETCPTGSGAGTAPASLVSMSAFAQNINTYEASYADGTQTWDMYANGGSTAIKDWKSPYDGGNDIAGDPNANYPYYSSHYEYEWSMVFEWSVNLVSAGCGADPVYVIGGVSHHSPAKDSLDPGQEIENDPFPQPEPGDPLSTFSDFGDLPDSYGTELGNGSSTGAAQHHILAGGVYLGSGLDADPDGAPSVGADGDDAAGADDEDGVTAGITSGWTPGSTQDFTVQSSGSGVLGAWIDWDGSGTFEAGEFYSAAVSAGPNTLSVTIPQGTGSDFDWAADQLHARFRLFSTTAAAPGGTLDSGDFIGIATDGEVEDHVFSYQVPTSVAAISGTVWENTNFDASIDTDEGRFQDVSVDLYRDNNGDGLVDAGDTLVDTMSTSAGGEYRFEGLSSGDYIVQVADTNGVLSDYAANYEVDTGTAGPFDAQASVTISGADAAGIDFGFVDPATVPVTLAFFHAQLGEDGQLVVELATATETGNLGFELFAERGGEWVQIGDRIESPVVDSVEPQFYRVELPYEGDLSFLLRDLDILGEVTDHGPFELGRAHGRPPSAGRVDWAAKRAERHAKRLARAEQRKERMRSLRTRWLERRAPQGESLLVLEVREAGIYRVTHDQLVAAGLDLTDVPVHRVALLDAAGDQVPLRVDGRTGRGGQERWRPGTSFTFIGEPREASLYGGTNRYRLTFLDGAVRMGEDAARAGRREQAAPYFMHTLEVAEQNRYSPAAPGGDPWFEKRMRERKAAYGLPFTVEHWVPEGAPAELQIELWGGLDYPYGGEDHHVIADLNGGPASELWFDGIETHRLQVNADRLQEGANTLRIRVPGDTGLPADVINYEGMRLRYPRAFVAGEDGLSFRAEGRKFTVRGLAHRRPEIYRLDDSGLVTRLTRFSAERSEDGSYAVTFAGTGAEATYHVIPSDQVKAPVIEPAPSAESCAGPIDYLAVVHPDLDTEPLERLLERRAAQGLSVHKVTTEGIYARYSGGLPDPSAIEACVGEAEGLHSLLLVGGDTYDPEDHLGHGSLSFVPTRYVPTGRIVRYTPCDSCYGFLEGEPRVAVGRIPARDEDELAGLIDRIEAYEDRAPNRSMVIAADAYDELQRYDFRADAEAVRERLPYDWDVQTVYLDDYTTADGIDAEQARADLIAAIEAGPGVTAYLGHSGPREWSSNGLLSLKDAAALDTGGGPTVVAQWGCWTTYYVSPSAETMAHALLLGSGEGGGSAAAVLGASTLTTAAEEAALAKQVVLSLSTPGTTLGQAVIEAKRAVMADNPGYLGVLYGWSLLGDPGMTVEPAFQP